MTFYYDLARGYFVSSNGSPEKVSTAEFKRGDTTSVSIIFCDGLTKQVLPDGATGVLGMKEVDKFDDGYLAAAAGWEKTGEGENAVYTFDLNLNTEALNEALGVGAGVDRASIPAMLELEFTVNAVVRSSNTVIATVYNDVVRDGIGMPIVMPGTLEFLGEHAVLHSETQTIDEAGQARVIENLGFTDIVKRATTIGTGGEGDDGKVAVIAGGFLGASFLVARGIPSEEFAGYVYVQGPTESDFVILDSQNVVGSKNYHLPNAAYGKILAVTDSVTGQITFADVATANSATFRGRITDAVGTGALYFVGGALGTPASVTLTNGTGLPISTGVSGLAAGIAAFLASPSSANLAAAVTNETGTAGALVFSNAPTFTGTATFSGPVNCADQVSLTGQAASSGDSAMNRDLTGALSGSARLLIGMQVPRVVNDYNGSNQTTAIRGWSIYGHMNDAVSPGAGMVRGTWGDVIGSGVSKDLYFLFGGSIHAPMTSLVVFRPTANSMGGVYRWRGLDVCRNGNVVGFRFEGNAGYVTSPTIAVGTNELCWAAWSQGATSVRYMLKTAAGYLSGTFADTYLTVASPLVSGPFQIGAGGYGAAAGLEHVAIEIYAGLSSFPQLRALIDRASSAYSYTDI